MITRWIMLWNKAVFCLEVLIYKRLQMWRHNEVIGRSEYLISTCSKSTVPYSLQFLFKSTHKSWRYGRKCEWVFFFWTQCSSSFSTMTLHWCNCLLYGHKWTRRWLRRPKSEAQILPQWGQTGPAGVAAAAACLRARRSLAACSAAAASLFRPVAHVKLHRILSSASSSSWDSGMLHFVSTYGWA